MTVVCGCGDPIQGYQHRIAGLHSMSHGLYASGYWSEVFMVKVSCPQCWQSWQSLGESFMNDSVLVWVSPVWQQEIVLILCGLPASDSLAADAFFAFAGGVVRGVVCTQAQKE